MASSTPETESNVDNRFQVLSRKPVLLIATYTFTLLFIAGYFVEGYARYSFSSVPVGWDTPWYIARINMARTGDILGVMQKCSYTNFLYPIAFSLLPFDAFTIEKFAPIFMALLFPVVAYFLTERTSEYSGIAAIFLVSTWFALYRLSSDLHANVLGVLILLAVSALMLDPLPLSKKRSVAVALGLLVGSFVHFETVLFFSIVILLVFFTIRRAQQDSQKRTALLGISIIPAFSLYVIKLYSRIQTEEGIATGNRPLWPEFFGNSLGLYLLPFVVAGILLLVLKRKKSGFDFFLLYWSGFSLLLILTSLVVPISNFSERALILFPSPFLLLPLVRVLGSKSRVPTPNHRMNISRILLSSLVLTTVISASAVVSFSLQYYPKTFISSAIIEQLAYLSDQPENVTGKMLFIYDITNPGVVELYDNWVTAIVGEHLSYYGNFYDLLQLKSGYDNLISIRFFNSLREMPSSEILSRTAVFLSQFYPDESIIRNVDAKILADGIYLCNMTKFAQKPYITLGFHDLDFSSYGHWYFNEGLDAYEIYSNETQDPYLFLNFDLPEGHYNLSLVYWDGSLGNGLQVFANNALATTIDYNASSVYQTMLVGSLHFNGSADAIKIAVFKHHSFRYFARLKSVIIAPNPFKPPSDS